MISMVRQHFVGAAGLDEAHAALLARLEERHGAADYRPDQPFDASEAMGLAADARTFVDTVRALLAQVL